MPKRVVERPVLSFGFSGLDLLGRVRVTSEGKTLRAIGLLLIVAASSAQVAVIDSLHQARVAYNERRFDDAISAAEAARSVPALANAAAVVLARARLERFRGDQGEPEDLSAARALLKIVDPAQLEPRDHVEYLIGLGEALYLDEPPQFGAAAEFFELALAWADGQDPAAREVVFEWWAGALDRLALFSPDADRRLAYDRLFAGAERERARDEGSVAAWYWLAVAARGTGDIDRAWSYAVAAWIRTSETGERGSRARVELDHLVTEVILPERAIRLAPGDARSALPLLQAEWDEIKRRWSR